MLPRTERDIEGPLCGGDEQTSCCRFHLAIGHGDVTLALLLISVATLTAFTSLFRLVVLSRTVAQARTLSGSSKIAEMTKKPAPK